MIPISFWGSPGISAALLETLLDHGNFDVRFVVSQPDKPRSRRGQKLMPCAVKQLASERDLPVYTPTSLKKEGDDLLAEWKQYNIDFHVILAYGKLIPESLFGYPRLHGVNFHASLLPQLRGAAPIEFSLMEGMKLTGWSLQQITRELDAGDVYWQSEVSIKWEDTRDSLYARLQENLLAEAPSTLIAYHEEKLTGREQEHELASFCGKIQTDMGELKWAEDVWALRRRAQALSSKPGVYASWRSKKAKLQIAFSIEKKVIEQTTTTEPPGTIVRIDDDVIWVACGDENCLPLASIQIEGKKAMSIKDFVNGYQPKLGDTFE